MGRWKSGEEKITVIKATDDQDVGSKERDKAGDIKK